jgi:hypothetical protein
MNVERSNIQPVVGQQTASTTKPGRLSGRAVARLAWSLLGVGIGLLALVLALELLNGTLAFNTIVYFTPFNAFLLVGVLIAARRPENPIGWMFCGAGLTTNLAFALLEYARLALVTRPGSLPGGIVAGWLWMLIGPIAWLLMFVSLMLFPTGRPVTRLLGLIIWADVVLFVVGTLAGAFASPTLGDIATVRNPLYIEGLTSFVNLSNSIFGGINVLALTVTALLRFRRSSQVERLQLKWFTYSVVLLILWSVLQGFLGIPEVVQVIISLLAILWLLVTVTIAIFRYRLYEIDVIINRTLVYVPLTGILAGLYAACVALLQRLFQAQTGESSDAAIVLTTLILTALFTPIRNGLQAIVDTRWKESSGSFKKLKAFGKQVEESFSPVDPGKVIHRLLVEAVLALRAKSGAAYLQGEGEIQLIHTYGDWQEGRACLEVHLESDGKQVGLIKLGNRGGEAEYSNRERKALQEVADVVANAISM